MNKTAIIIQKKLDELLQKGSATVMLTGGRSAAQLYTEWKNLPNFKKIINTLEKDWVYCFYSDNDLDSSKAAKHLSNTGIKQVYYLKKGIKDWMKHKYPMADKK